MRGKRCRPGETGLHPAVYVLLQLFFPIVLLIDPGVDKQRQRQNTTDHAQRNADGNMVKIDDQHFDADKYQNHRQAILQH